MREKKTQKVELWIIRHGRTEWNDSHRVQGWKDSPLLERSVDQARRFGKILNIAGVQFDRIVSSDSGRAKKTCENICPNQDVETDLRLRERTWGEFDGQTKIWRKIRSGGKLPFPGAIDSVTIDELPYGIETVKSVMARAMEALHEISEEAVEKNQRRVLIGSHSGTLAAIALVVQGLDKRSQLVDVKNGNCTVLEFHTERRCGQKGFRFADYEGIGNKGPLRIMAYNNGFGLLDCADDETTTASKSTQTSVSKPGWIVEMVLANCLNLAAFGLFGYTVFHFASDVFSRRSLPLFPGL